MCVHPGSKQSQGAAIAGTVVRFVDHRARCEHPESAVRIRCESSGTRLDGPQQPPIGEVLDLPATVRQRIVAAVPDQAPLVRLLELPEQYLWQSVATLTLGYTRNSLTGGQVQRSYGAAVHVHLEQTPRPIAVGRERKPRPVRRPVRVRIEGRVVGEVDLLRSAGKHPVHVVVSGSVRVEGDGIAGGGPAGTETLILRKRDLPRIGAVRGH